MLKLCLAALTAAGTVVAAHAEPMFGRPGCGPARLLAEALADRYGETVRSATAMPDGWVVEVWISEEKGTGSIVMVSPDGETACLVAASGNAGRAA